LSLLSGSVSRSSVGPKVATFSLTITTQTDPERTRSASAELVALAPDAILAYANPAVASLMQVTHTIPIVFTQASDPVGSGFVSNLAHPGGNITGFHSFEPAIAAKWLDVLKQLAPSVRTVTVLHDPGIAANMAFLRTAEAASGTFGVTVTAAGGAQRRRDQGYTNRVCKRAGWWPDRRAGATHFRQPPDDRGYGSAVASASGLFLQVLCHQRRFGLI
jgi:ABC-type uncharacterized transport system substrate-binding protein